MPMNLPFRVTAGRGVGSQNGFGLADAVKGFEEVFFDVDVFNNRFNDEVRVGCQLEIRGEGDMALDRLLVLRRQLAFFNKPSECFVLLRAGFADNFIRDVTDNDVKALLRENLGNIGTHRTGADYTDFFHRTFLSGTLLLIFELCHFAFADKRRHGVLLVFRGKAEAKSLSFISKACVDIGLHAVVDGRLTLSDSNLGVGGNFRRHPERRVHQLLVGNDLADKADPESFFC